MTKVSPMRSVKGKEVSKETLSCWRCFHSAFTQRCAQSTAVCCRMSVFLLSWTTFHALCRPDRVSDVYVALQEELWAHSRIQVQQGKTQLWNRSGSPPSGWQALTAAARISDPEAVVWRGDPSLPFAEQGVKVLGTPLGHTEFPKAQLREVINSHSVFVGAHPVCSGPSVSLASLGLLRRNKSQLRSVPPDVADEYARDHDAAMRRCKSQLLDVEIPDESWAVASLPLSIGGLGLRNASRMSTPACWASWADCLHTVQQRHLVVVIRSPLRCHVARGRCLDAAARCRERPLDVSFEAPRWEDLQEGPFQAARIGRCPN